jgi:hypothetical protein
MSRTLSFACSRPPTSASVIFPRSRTTSFAGDRVSVSFSFADSSMREMMDFITEMAPTHPSRD